MKKIKLLVLSIGFISLSFSQTLVTVKERSSLKINSGTTFSNSEIVLKSVSDSYSNLILDGSLGLTPADVDYDRYVNVIGSGARGTGGNDLVSFPVFTAGDDFEDFLAYGDNASDLASNPSDVNEYAFGPYVNTNPTGYVNFNNEDNDVLTIGKGYRAATRDPDLDTFGETIRFTGTVSNIDETVAITSAENRWNLVGNPYPSYIDSQIFLHENINLDPANSTLDPNAAAIYAYNAGTVTGANTIGNFTIINKIANTDINIAPGQGFFVSDNSLNTQPLQFTLAMRTFNGTDDFILGKSSNQIYNLRLLASNDTDSFATEFFFSNKTTDGLDVGYDATIYSAQKSNFMLYSHLVANNSGKNMAIQALSDNFNENVIPLGIKAAQGQQITIGIENTNLPDHVQLYLEDNFNNSFTLLNEGDYTFSAEKNLDGTGRFFLRTTNASLSAPAADGDSLNVFSVRKQIFIKGKLLAKSQLNIYDINGRNVFSHQLNSDSKNNQVDVSSLNSGVYISKISNDNQKRIQKIIIK